VFVREGSSGSQLAHSIACEYLLFVFCEDAANWVVHASRMCIASRKASKGSEK
jgi:hypothetical protein